MLSHHACGKRLLSMVGAAFHFYVKSPPKPLAQLPVVPRKDLPGTSDCFLKIHGSTCVCLAQCKSSSPPGDQPDIAETLLMRGKATSAIDRHIRRAGGIPPAAAAPTPLKLPFCKQGSEAQGAEGWAGRSVLRDRPRAHEGTNSVSTTDHQVDSAELPTHSCPRRGPACGPGEGGDSRAMMAGPRSASLVPSAFLSPPCPACCPLCCPALLSAVSPCLSLFHHGPGVPLLRVLSLSQPPGLISCMVLLHFPPESQSLDP